MTFVVNDLAAWDGATALFLDGGDGPRARPPLHLQAAHGGYLRLMGPHRPVLWGRVAPDHYEVDCLRSREAPLHVLPMLHAGDVEAAPRGDARIGWWTRRFAELLCASEGAPLAAGRQYLFARDEVRFPAALQQRLSEQRERFAIDWDRSSVVMLRPYAPADDGRVKSWRKRAREGTLPPLVAWWCQGLFSHVLLDGHDRLQAALLEGVPPDVLVLADVRPHAAREVEARQHEAAEHAAVLAHIGSDEVRARVMNTILWQAWDPRRTWDIATPGFPLDVATWTWETRDWEL